MSNTPYRYPPGFSSRLDRLMWRSTDWMLYRYVRFAFLGVSLIAAVWAMTNGLVAVINHDMWAWALDFVFGLANGFLFGWNLRRYQKDFWRER